MVGKIAVGIVVVVLGYLAWTLSPWPSALFYRALMNIGGIADNAGLAKHVPDGVAEERDVVYAPDDPDALLDVYRPRESEGRALPVIVWVHGGGYLSGSKDHIANYLKILAGNGYVTVGVNYALAPSTQYPEPIRQVASAVAFLQANAGRFGIDATRFALAGDSAGAQIAAQVATVISSPDYAHRIGVTAPIARERLRGALLFCGLYDPDSKDNASKYAQFLRTATWSYFGVEDLSGDARSAQFSIVKNVTPGFPPLFVSAGNADPLESQARKLAATARSEGVPVDTLFFDKHHKPELPHEYQFNLDTAEGRLALDRAVAFLHRALHGATLAKPRGIASRFARRPS